MSSRRECRSCGHALLQRGPEIRECPDCGGAAVPASRRYARRYPQATCGLPGADRAARAYYHRTGLLAPVDGHGSRPRFQRTWLPRVELLRLGSRPEYARLLARHGLINRSELRYVARVCQWRSPAVMITRCGYGAARGVRARHAAVIASGLDMLRSIEAALAIMLLSIEASARHDRRRGPGPCTCSIPRSTTTRGQRGQCQRCQQAPRNDLRCACSLSSSSMPSSSAVQAESAMHWCVPRPARQSD